MRSVGGLLGLVTLAGCAQDPRCDMLAEENEHLALQIVDLNERLAARGDRQAESLLRQVDEAGRVAQEPAQPETPEPVADPAEAPAVEAPLVPVRARVRINSAGTSELSITVANDGRRAIDGFRFEAQCFNNFNERVRNERSYRPGTSDLFGGISSDHIRAGQERTLGTWSMFDFDTCTKAIVTITSVHFVDGQTWLGRAVQEEDPRQPQR